MGFDIDHHPPKPRREGDEEEVMAMEQRHGDYVNLALLLPEHHQQDPSANINASNNELRIHVYREIACIPWSLKPYPNFREPAPTVVNSSDTGTTITTTTTTTTTIDSYLWGGLYTTLNEITLPYLQRYYRVAFLIYFVSLFPFMFWFSDWWPKHMSNSNSAEEEEDDTFLFFFMTFGIASMLLGLSMIPAWLLTRSSLREMHIQIQEALQREMIPCFRVAGYDLQYETQRTRILWYAEYIRVIPYYRDDTQKQSTPPMFPTSNNPGLQQLPISQAAARNEFRVGVFGGKAALGRSWCGPAEHTLLRNRTPDVQLLIDPFTWGQVAIAMRPYAIQFVNVRSYLILSYILVWQCILHLPNWIHHTELLDSWWYVLVPSIVISILMFGDNLGETFVLNTVMRQDVLRQMRETIEQLSPIVEVRSGYQLEFVVEPGCCGSWWTNNAYVHFYPTTTAAAVATPTGDTVDGIA